MNNTALGAENKKEQGSITGADKNIDSLQGTISVL